MFLLVGAPTDSAKISGSSSFSKNCLKTQPTLTYHRLRPFVFVFGFGFVLLIVRASLINHSHCCDCRRRRGAGGGPRGARGDRNVRTSTSGGERGRVHVLLPGTRIGRRRRARYVSPFPTFSLIHAPLRTVGRLQRLRLFPFLIRCVVAQPSSRVRDGMRRPDRAWPWRRFDLFCFVSFRFVGFILLRFDFVSFQFWLFCVSAVCGG